MSETDLALRLERLERDNRRLKGFAIATVVVAAALASIFAGQPVPDVISAHEFSVLDDSGRARAQLKSDPKGVELLLLAEDGKPGVQVSLFTSGYELIGLNGTKSSLVMAAGAAAVPNVAIYDAHQNMRAELGINHSDEPGLQLIYPDGQVAMHAQVDSSGDPSVAVLGKRGESAIAMMGVLAGHPVSGLFDAQGNPRISTRLDAAGQPTIALIDSQGFSLHLGATSTVKPVTGETQQTSAASIVMFGNEKDHHVIWQAP